MKNILRLSLILQSVFSFGQVGINTKSPKGIFHIDTSKNNPTDGSNPTVNQEADDFLVLQNGSVGLGTLSPSAKLDIRSSNSPAFILVDGHQAEKSVLVSGTANGNAGWSKAVIRAITGVMAGGVNIPLSTTDYNYDPSNLNVGLRPTGSYIELPPGKWLLTMNLQFKISLEQDDMSNPNLNYGSWFYIRFSFSDTNLLSQNLISSSFEDPNNVIIWKVINGPTNVSYNIGKYASVYGQLVIENKTSNPKKYYLLVGGIRKSDSNLQGTAFDIGGNNQGNIISALPILD